MDNATVGSNCIIAAGAVVLETCIVELAVYMAGFLLRK